MAELLLRFLLDVVVYTLVRVLVLPGYYTARAIVPLFSSGRLMVAPPPNNAVVFTRWHGFHRLSDGSVVVGTGMASFLGTLFLIAVLIIAALAARLPR
jgi:hypothetical protein